MLCWNLYTASAPLDNYGRINERKKKRRQKYKKNTKEKGRSIDVGTKE
jgi:hypothetical protein